MTEQDDQWPESLRIMREQRERIEALEARLYGDRELWCDQCDDDSKARAQAEADANGVPVHVNVHGVRQWTAKPSRIAALEADAERWRICKRVACYSSTLVAWCVQLRNVAGDEDLDIDDTATFEQVADALIDDAARAAGGEHGTA